MFRLNVANVDAEGMADMLTLSGVRGAKILEGVGLWEGQLERCVDVVVYDEIDPEVVLDYIGRQMPDEMAFGLDEALWENPYHAASRAA